MTGGAQLYYRLVQQQDRVGGMGRMARRAHPILYRGVFGNSLFLSFNRVLVATAAEAFHRVLFQQSGLFGSMRAMTVQTAPTINHRPVNPVLGKGLIDHVVVASATKLKAGFLRLERRR